MKQRELEKQRLFSIVAYCDEMSPIQARIIYMSEHKTDIALEQVRKLLVELADDGTITQPRKGVYTKRIEK